MAHATKRAVKTIVEKLELLNKNRNTMDRLIVFQHLDEITEQINEFLLQDSDIKNHKTIKDHLTKILGMINSLRKNDPIILDARAANDRQHEQGRDTEGKYRTGLALATINSIFT